MPELPERDPLQGREIPPRGDFEFYEMDADQANQQTADWLAKLSVLGVGAHVLGKKSGYNFIADMLDLAGASARWMGGLTTKKVVGPTIRPEVGKQLEKALDISIDGGADILKRQFGGARLDEVESIQSIIDSLGVIYDPKNHRNREALTQGFKEYLGRMPRRTAESAQGFFHHDLEQLTFGDLLDNASTWIERVGSNKMPTKNALGRTNSLEIASINKAIDLGWISKDTIIDPKLFKSKRFAHRGKLGPSLPSKIVDTRILDPKYALTQISRSIEIGNVVSGVASLFGNAKNIAMLGPEQQGGLGRVFMGGDVFEIPATGSLRKIASNRRLGKVNDPLFKASRLREATQKGKLSELYTGPEKNTFWSRLQHKAGIGVEFQERAGGPFQSAYRFLRNLRGVATGEAVLAPTKYKRAGIGIQDILLGDTIPGETFAKEAGKVTRGKFSGQLPDRFAPNFFDRIKAYLGISEDITIVKRSAIGKTSYGKEDLYSPFRTGGIGSLETPIGISQAPTGVSIGGSAKFEQRPQFYASSASTLDKAYDFSNFMLIRLNTLASSSLGGIGFRASGNLLANASRLAAIQGLYMAGTEAAKYVGYKTGLTNFAADLYTEARVQQQEVREATGIAGVANEFEQIFPGLSFGLLGTLGAAGAGLVTLGKTGRLGLSGLVAGSIYGTIGGPDVGQSAQELSEEYSGERKVAHRKAAWWAFGYQPFVGGPISHYGPSWYTRLKQQPYKTNVYGSEKDYWSEGTYLPTLENWFHIKTVLDPYKTERDNYYSRPYPMTGTFFEDVPLFGPLLADTFGTILKPRLRMHQEDYGAATATENINRRHVPADVASRLGIPELPIAGVEMGRPDIVADRLEKYANVALEPTGIWKFVLGHFGVKFDEGFKMADASNMSSSTRAFYEAGIGGGLGQTEMIRRFFLSEYGRPHKIAQQINPIANTVAPWLPGSLSQYEQDRSYFIDLTRGDPYTKIPGGEYRLPGAGYESVNPLHSGQSGVYDAVDRLLILSDVAPWSAAYFSAKREVNRDKLSPFWRKQVLQAEENRNKKIDKYGFSQRAQDQAAAANLSPIGRGMRNAYETVHREILSEIPWIGSKIFPKRDPLEHYIKFKVEGETFADWNNPYEAIVRPAIYDVVNENPLVATIKGAGLAALSAGILPGTGAARFLNPIQAMSNSVRPGAFIAGTAIAAGGASAARMVLTGQATGGLIPNHIQRERNVEEYFDKLEYVKYKALAKKAELEGQHDIGQSFTRKYQKTTTYGLEKLRESGSVQAYTKTLSTDERTYFEAFLELPRERQKQALNVVPDHMKEALNAIFSREFSKKPMEEELKEFFQENGMPAASWVGWHPGVAEEAIRIKTIQGGIGNLSTNVHRMGIYPTEVREAEVRYPFVEAALPEVYPDNGLDWITSALTKPNAFSFGTGPRMSVGEFTLYDDRRDDIFFYMNDLAIR